MTGNNAPPHVTYNPDTMLAYINVTELDEDEAPEIMGLYTRRIYNQEQELKVFVNVIGEGGPVGK